MLLSEMTRLRIASGLSVSAMARTLGVTPPTIYKWERAKKPLPLFLVAYRQVLRVSGNAELPPDQSRTPLALRYQPGTRVGRLVVTATAGREQHSLRVCVLCDCGKSKTMRAASLATVRQCSVSCRCKGEPMPDSAPAPRDQATMDELLSPPAVTPIVPRKLVKRMTQEEIDKFETIEERRKKKPIQEFEELDEDLNEVPQDQLAAKRRQERRELNQRKAAKKNSPNDAWIYDDL